MKAIITSDHSPRLIIRGIHLWLGESMKRAVAAKAAPLFRQEPRIVRLRIDIGRDLRRRSCVFTAKGRIEIAGPDLSASVTSDHAHTSINLLIDKLGRMLRKRMTDVLRRRTADDIRTYTPEVIAV